jgi:hypothetical protein
MSTEPEDLLEEALRGDFPSADTEARVRRRLLAAGVALGNGVATTTATAAGATKLAGLSWGLKLGLAAAVAIPSVGLLLDERTERSTGTAVAQVASHRGTTAAPSPVPSTKTTATAAVEAVPAVVPVSQAPDRLPPRVAKAADAGTAAPAQNASPLAPPSQADFTAAVEAPARPPEAASTLAEETRLLDQAFAELTAGNRSHAAALIREHETRFPAGLLQKERERAKTRLSELSRGE